MSLQGTWVFTQQWQGQPAYHFNAELGGDGSIKVDGGYFGTWTQLGSSNQLALGIANFQQQSVTSYSGNVAGPAMGGEMTGGTPGGQIFKGVWSAQQTAHAEAEHRALDAPGK